MINISGLEPAKVRERMRRYMCDVCGETFSSSYGLQRHEESHNSHTTESSNGLVCLECNKTYKSRRSLHTHKLRIHLRPNKELVCGICQFYGKDNNELRIHKLKHVPKEIRRSTLRFDCEICGKKIASQSALDMHVKNFHKLGDSRCKENYKHSCESCTMRFRTVKYLNRHYGHFHPEVRPPARTGFVKSNGKRLLQPELSELRHQLLYEKSDEIEETENGEMIYKTVKIFKTDKGFECSMCGLKTEDPKTEGLNGSAVKAHIKACHIGKFNESLFLTRYIH
jgi:uncharacterized Zn-finger protein